VTEQKREYQLTVDWYVSKQHEFDTKKFLAAIMPIFRCYFAAVSWKCNKRFGRCEQERLARSLQGLQANAIAARFVGRKQVSNKLTNIQTFYLVLGLLDTSCTCFSDNWSNSNFAVQTRGAAIDSQPTSAASIAKAAACPTAKASGDGSGRPPVTLRKGVWSRV